MIILPQGISLKLSSEYGSAFGTPLLTRPNTVSTGKALLVQSPASVPNMLCGKKEKKQLKKVRLQLQCAKGIPKVEHDDSPVSQSPESVQSKPPRWMAM